MNTLAGYVLVFAIGLVIAGYITLPWGMGWAIILLSIPFFYGAWQVYERGKILDAREKRTRHAEAEGLPASLVILKAEPGSKTVPRYRLTLEVTPEGHPPYTVHLKQTIHPALIARLELEQVYPGKVALDDPEWIVTRAW